MTPEQKAAYVNAQAAAALITAMGMHAENMQRQATGKSMAYNENDFQVVIQEHRIHHNAVVEEFVGGNP